MVDGMLYDEETLKNLEEGYIDAMKSPESRCKGALFGKIPFVTEEGEGVKRCKDALKEPYAIVLKLIEMSKPYQGVPAECVKEILGSLKAEFERFGVACGKGRDGDFIMLARELLKGVEKAILHHPCGVIDRILARCCCILTIYLNN